MNEETAPVAVRHRDVEGTVSVKIAKSNGTTEALDRVGVIRTECAVARVGHDGHAPSMRDGQIVIAIAVDVTQGDWTRPGNRGPHYDAATTRHENRGVLYGRSARA